MSVVVYALLELVFEIFTHSLIPSPMSGHNT
jgi:hypothetical protein